MKVDGNMNESEKQGLSNINENVDQPLLTVKEAANHVGETTAVIRNWMNELKNHIPTVRGDNNYHYFDKNALEVLVLIKKLSREQNYSIKQINHYFNSGGESFKPDLEPIYQEKILDELKFLKEQFELQQQFNQALTTKLEEQQRYIDETLAKRNNEITNSIRLLQETKQEVAASEKKGFFAKLFSK